MKKNRLGLGALSIVAASALALTACGGSDSGSKGSSKGGSFALNASSISVDGVEPQNPLVPTNTTEVGGGMVVEMLFAGLTSFDSSGEVRLDQAESIEPNADNTEWDIKLKADQKFSDGTPVTAENYIKAWNYGANLKNAQGSASFFENIQGYSDKKKQDLTGLEKVSDTEFKVKLINPESEFKLRLGYSAFVPMPDSAFKDMKAFGNSPIGNGPYKLADKKAWHHKQGVNLVKNDNYSGPQEAKNKGIDVKFYTDPAAAYADVQGGNLDILRQIPDSAFKTYKKDFPKSNVNQAAAIFQAFTIPQYLDHFKPGKEGQLRREAISKAIDREAITKTIFDGTRTPAKDFTSPVLAGWDESVKNIKGNDVLKFDPKEAKKLWAEADKISKYSGTFTLAYNGDGGHKGWVTAVTNQLSKNLGIKAEGNPYPEFKQQLDDETNNKMTGAFRDGWQADYPSVGNFLTPLYKTGAGTNYGRYDSKTFNDQLAAASSAKDDADRTAKFNAAQETLLTDLPDIPLWYANAQSVWNKDLKNVEINWKSVPEFYAIEK